MAFLRQVFTLIRKDLIIVVQRRWFSTFWRALAMPILFMFFISYVRNFFLPPSEYGFGTAKPIRNLTTDILNSGVLSGRHRIAFVNSGFSGGQIDAVINILSTELTEAGFDVRTLSSDEQLSQVCQSSLSGLSPCYASATFQSSPTEGTGGTWSYLARADFSLGTRIYINSDTNDAQIYALPFTQAVDQAIARQSGLSYPSSMNELPFTDETVQQRNDNIQQFYMGALVNYLAVAFFIGICGIAYHLPGHISTERESGMSQLIDAMIPRRHQWLTQAARLIATHISFDLVYLPGWLSIGAIVATLVFQRTSTGATLLFHVLTGLSLTGYALLGGVFFRRSQLSGITVLIVSLVLAIIAQFALNNAIANIALSIIFPSVNYTRFMIYLARWERALRAANFLHAVPYVIPQGPPGYRNPYSQDPAGYLYFVFAIVQAVVYPILALTVERLLYGTSSRSRHLESRGLSGNVAVELRAFSKHFHSGSSTIKAVDGLSFEALKGQVLVLLGANGSGKSTTLNAISGVESISRGDIYIDSTGGLGLCPQKNVLWDELTVFEHVKIFNRLKSQHEVDSRSQIRDLVHSCDLEHKVGKKSKTLSGGQKRKLQLAMAYTGGSKVCCIDEVTSGLDPLSRRKIWQILTSQKGKRTFLFTTHALDEADALSDNILLMSKGHLKAYGTAAELKNRYGGNYKVLVNGNVPTDSTAAIQPPRTLTSEGLVFHVSSDELQPFLAHLARHNISDYQVVGPTIENVFLNLATEIEEDLPQTAHHNARTYHTQKGPLVRTISEESLPDRAKGGFQLTKGRGTSFTYQIWILFAKRLRILSRNYLPYFCAILVPLATAGLTAFFLAGFDGLTCALGANANNPEVISFPVLYSEDGVNIPVGPSSGFSASQVPQAYQSYANLIHPQADYDAFNSYIHQFYRSVVPGGFYLANSTDPPLLAYRANGGIYYAALAKTAFDSYLMGTPIVSSFSTFALPITGSTGDSLQLVVYIGLAMCAYPAFFGLYPTFERLRNIRALHFSNGIRGPSLWLAYAFFDGLFVLVISIAAIVMLVELSDVWYAPGYLFVVFLLYGIASTLLSYIISLYATSQLAAFAFSAGGQAVLLLIYFILYLVLITFSIPEVLYHNLNAVQFTYGLITPSGNLLRALLLTLNQSQLLCRNQGYVSYPGDITVFGGPIFYLTLQIFAFYFFLVQHERGMPAWLKFTRRSRFTSRDTEKDAIAADPDVATEITRTERSQDGLRVLHLSKHFGREHAVDDLTFGVEHGEVFALLGPNGAGKSTTISLIRGNLKPSDRASDILIEGNSTRVGKKSFRRNLGVCPQFDAIDRMTVAEHLRFYARAAGVPNVKHNVSQLINAVGLAPFRDRMAAKLSGGNQRKLSLAIAIIGDPSIVLLDEPSSGMDAVTKRIMWKVLKSVKGGRSLVITTHSMEEVSALADRAGIMAKRMLAVGTTSSLRMKHGNAYHVQLVHRDGSLTTPADAERVAAWVHSRFPRATAENTMLHGQFKFAVSKMIEVENNDDGTMTMVNAAATILQQLEQHKDALGIKYYSFGETTLEDVFLNIVGQHRVHEQEQVEEQQQQRLHNGDRHRISWRWGR